MKGCVSSCRSKTMTVQATLEGQSVQMEMERIPEQGKKVKEMKALQNHETPQREKEEAMDSIGRMEKT